MGLTVASGRQSYHRRKLINLNTVFIVSFYFPVICCFLFFFSFFCKTVIVVVTVIALNML